MTIAIAELIVSTITVHDVSVRVRVRVWESEVLVLTVLSANYLTPLAYRLRVKVKQ